MRLAQFELLADQYTNSSKSDLLDKINQAKAIDATLYGSVEYLELLGEIAIAETLYEKADLTGKEISSAIERLQGAIDRLVLIKKAYVPFNATDFSSVSSGINKESTTTAAGGALLMLWKKGIK